jgi:hypothetical protein
LVIQELGEEETKWGGVKEHIKRRSALMRGCKCFQVLIGSFRRVYFSGKEIRRKIFEYLLLKVSFGPGGLQFGKGVKDELMTAQ